MDREITQRFVSFLQGKFGARVELDPTATDVLRQPLFPGLDGKPRELNEVAGGFPGGEFSEYDAGMDMLPPMNPFDNELM